MICRRVSREWYQLLPGLNTEIARILFFKPEFAAKKSVVSMDGDDDDDANDSEDEDNEDDNEDEGNGGDEPIYCGEEDENDEEKYHTEGGYGKNINHTQVGTPCVIVLLRAPLSLYTKLGLPHPEYRMEIVNMQEIGWEDYVNCTGFEQGTMFHPMVENIANYMDLLNRNFSTEWLHPRLIFQTREELYVKTRMPTEGEYKDGTWKDMLISRPAVRKVNFSFRWPYHRARRLYTVFEAEEGRGVTVGQFFYYIRRMLSHAKNDYDGFAGEMAVFHERCCIRGTAEERDGWGDH